MLLQRQIELTFAKISRARGCLVIIASTDGLKGKSVCVASSLAMFDAFPAAGCPSTPLRPTAFLRNMLCNFQQKSHHLSRATQKTCLSNIIIQAIIVKKTTPLQKPHVMLRHGSAISTRFPTRQSIHSSSKALKDLQLCSYGFQWVPRRPFRIQKGKKY